MRVGLDARLWHNTGIGRYVRNLAPRLAGVQLVVWAAPEHLDEVRAALPHSEVLPCAARPFSLAEQRFFPGAIAAAKLDVFHTPHLNAPLFCPVPLVVTIHDLIPLHFPETINSRLGHAYFVAMSHLAVRRSQRVIAVSENTREDLLRLLRAPSERLRVVGEGADALFERKPDAETMSRVRERFALAGPYVLYSGQSKPYKNQATLLRAFARLGRPELKLVFAGRIDPNQPHVEALIRELGLEHAVVRTGYLDEDELVALYHGASVFAFPSRYEGFGLPPLEAMAAGVPVVASRAASIPEVVGPAGILLDPDDVVQWAEAIDQVLSDAALRDRLITAGHERVRLFSWDAAARDTLAVYRELSQGTPP
ncbi:MAG TPA: glycosyltransferase family 1 protein [Oscillatoriaceae cyanobacterium]